jgi:PilZ domain
MSSERRSYFRIDETIAIEYKKVDEITANTAIPELQFPDAGSIKLFSELRKIDTDNNHILHQIKETHRALGEYLHNLNRKIDIISQQILADSKPAPLSKTIKQVNLSEGGLGFGCSEAFKSGDCIALRLVFLPSNAGLVVFAKIIRCDPSPDPKSSGEFHIAAKFHRITDTQQQLVGQQIMRSQMAERRRNAKNLQ